MDYSEAKYQALKNEKQIARHAVENSGRKTTNEFLSIYSRALESYLLNQFKGNEKVHKASIVELLEFEYPKRIKVKLCRVALELSQSDLSKLSNLTQTQISAFEVGKTKQISLSIYIYSDIFLKLLF